MSYSWASPISSASSEAAPEEIICCETASGETVSFDTASYETASYVTALEETTSDETTASEDITDEAKRKRSFAAGVELLNSDFDDEDPEPYRADAPDRWLQEGLKYVQIDDDTVERTQRAVLQLDCQREMGMGPNTGVWVTFEG